MERIPEIEALIVAYNNFGEDKSKKNSKELRLKLGTLKNEIPTIRKNLVEFDKTS